MKFAVAAAVFTLASAANAALQVTSPSADTWWVAKSANTFAWTCKDSPASSFTVLIGNKDPKILTAPMPFIAIVQNADCSEQVSIQQADQPAGTGYTLYLANILNGTDIYAQSEEFEIKPLGSIYPSQQQNTSPSGSGGSSGSGSAPAPTQSSDGKNGAMNIAASGLFAVAAMAVGLVLA